MFFNINEKLRELLPKKKTKEELDAYTEKKKKKKGDFLAMVIAALITFLPVLIVAMLVVYGLIWLIMIR
jgi:flagellar basal body-associated protein FliL